MNSLQSTLEKKKQAKLSDEVVIVQQFVSSHILYKVKNSEFGFEDGLFACRFNLQVTNSFPLPPLPKNHSATKSV
jgi:hypothetical protein